MSKGKSMSKRTRTLILACVAVVALGGILTALLLIPPKESASSSEVSSDPSISLLDKSKGADDKTVDDPVKTMTVKLQGEEFTLVKNSDGDMVVEAYKDLPIGTSNIDYLISAVTTISASKKLGAVENPADFGFDKPLATVNVTYHDDSTYAFEIGAKTPLEDGYYYRVKDSGEVYIVETSLGDEVSQASTAYIGTTLMTAPTKNDDDENGQAVLRDMELSGTARKQTFAFRQVTSSDTKMSLYSYMLTKPYLRGVNSNLAQTLSTFTSLTASSAFKAYPTKEDLTKYGFDKPYTVAKLNTAPIRRRGGYHAVHGEHRQCQEHFPHGGRQGDPVRAEPLPRQRRIGRSAGGEGGRQDLFHAHLPEPVPDSDGRGSQWLGI